jgi:hypothetical protein
MLSDEPFLPDRTFKFTIVAQALPLRLRWSRQMLVSAGSCSTPRTACVPTSLSWAFSLSVFVAHAFEMGMCWIEGWAVPRKGKAQGAKIALRRRESLKPGLGIRINRAVLESITVEVRGQVTSSKPVRPTRSR